MPEQCWSFVLQQTYRALLSRVKFLLDLESVTQKTLEGVTLPYVIITVVPTIIYTEMNHLAEE